MLILNWKGGRRTISRIYMYKYNILYICICMSLCMYVIIIKAVINSDAHSHVYSLRILILFLKYLRYFIIQV